MPCFPSSLPVYLSVLLSVSLHFFLPAFPVHHTLSVRLPAVHQGSTGARLQRAGAGVGSSHCDRTANLAPTHLVCSLFATLQATSHLCNDVTHVLCAALAHLPSGAAFPMVTLRCLVLKSAPPLCSRALQSLTPPPGWPDVQILNIVEPWMRGGKGAGRPQGAESDGDAQ